MAALRHARSHRGASRHFRRSRSAAAKAGKASQPDVLFNLAEQFKNNPGFDQNIVSFLEMQGVPFTGCGATGLSSANTRASRKKSCSYHHIHVPHFVVIPRGQRIARPKQLKFPILVKPVKEEASYGISQASFVENDEQFSERVAFIHEKHDTDVIAEEYIEGRELYVESHGQLAADSFSHPRAGLSRSAA